MVSVIFVPADIRTINRDFRCKLFITKTTKWINKTAYCSKIAERRVLTGRRVQHSTGSHLKNSRRRYVIIKREAELVHAALIARGLETPLREQTLPPETRKVQIEAHMTEIMKLLNLDLSDDSLADTPKRIAKMYVDEIFQDWIITISRKSP